MAKDPQDHPKPAKAPREPATGTPAGGPTAGGTPVGGTPVGGTPAGRPETGAGDGRPEDPMRVTRSGVMWTATVLALVFLVLLIIFIAQNTNSVQLQYFGLQGTVQLGLALFVASVGGGIVVAIVGAARILQLRTIARKGRVKPGKPGKSTKK